MIWLSAKRRHSTHTRIRFFLGGTLLSLVTSFTFYVTCIYNSAIATSNAQLVANSVIMYVNLHFCSLFPFSLLTFFFSSLFVTDLDDLFYQILASIDASWIKKMSYDDGEIDAVASAANAAKQDDCSPEEEDEYSPEEEIDLLRSQNEEMQQKLQRVESKLEEMSRTMLQMMQRGQAGQVEASRSLMVASWNGEGVE